MEAETVIAVAATVVAVGSLWVSWTQTAATREHNRLSVRPVLQFRRFRDSGEDHAGIRLSNAGLGPAVITRCEVRIDGEDFGGWSRRAGARVSELSGRGPLLYSLHPGTVLLAGERVFPSRLVPFDREADAEYWRIVDERLEMVVHYESVYGGEGLTAHLRPNAPPPRGEPPAPGPSAPGPPAPGPSAPGPSAPGPSAPGP
ncbi:hypothetical protein [Streptomyces sp. NPDC088674]|uniref:hypothetical protein n=3 Tax=unclassified Streptomyces TaxID=2593676 RepID=UPI00381F1922